MLGPSQTTGPINWSKNMHVTGQEEKNRLSVQTDGCRDLYEIFRKKEGNEILKSNDTLLQKLTITQLVRYLKIHCHPYISPLLNPIFREMKPAHIVPPHFFQVYFNTILPSIFLPNSLFTIRPNVCMHYLIATSHMIRPSHSS